MFLLYLTIVFTVGDPTFVAFAAQSSGSVEGSAMDNKATRSANLSGATSSSPKSNIGKSNPGLYFACERKLALKGKRIKASDWLGKTSKALSYGDRAADCDTLYSEEQLFERLSAEVKSSGQPLTVFIHGCCVSFSEDLIQANDIHKALQSAGLNGPLLAYDWATPCYNYPGSLAKLPRCRTSFTSFLERLVAKLGRDKIVIVAHSLGIHALQNYCQRALETEPKATQAFAAVILSRPDVDFSSFKSSEEALKKFSNKLMLLCARNDINLKLSSFIRRAGYSFVEDPRPVRDNHLRLGQASVASGVADQLAVYDISQLRLKHLIPYKLIAGLLTGETSSYLIERVDGGVMEVKNRL
ncbi:MAG: alpha/beta hydrolase [Candidatus Melainabacteria bacterium]|nr:alpha/beta hydrolase [Candidatus Melainabacteria bacterium]